MAVEVKVTLPGQESFLRIVEVAEKLFKGTFGPWQSKRMAAAELQNRLSEKRALAQVDFDVDAIKAGRAHLTADGLLLPGPADHALAPTTATAEVVPAIPPAAEVMIGLLTDEARKQSNVAAALEQAAAVLTEEPQTLPDARVADDWLFRWRDAAGGVGDKDLQIIWGRILAGEMKSPGRFSLRTLEFVRNLSQREAELVAQLAGIVCGNLLIRPPGKGLDDFNLPYAAQIELSELGVISGIELGFSVQMSTLREGDYFQKLVCHDKVLLIQAPDPAKILKLSVISVSALGRELMNLGGFQANAEYLRAIGTQIAKDEFKVYLADVVPVSPGRITWRNTQPIVIDGESRAP